MDLFAILESLNRRLAALHSGDPGPLMNDGALAECDTAIDEMQAQETDYPRACSIVGSVIWYWYEWNPERTGLDRFSAAAIMLAIAAKDDPGSVPMGFLHQILEAGMIDVDVVVGRLTTIGADLIEREGLVAKQLAEYRFVLAYSLLADDHRHKAAVGRQVARVNGLLYDLTRRPAALDKAISVGRAALLLAQDRDVNLEIAFGLSVDLRKRFRDAGDYADLDRSQDLCAQLIRAVPDDDPRFADYMSSYANTLLQRASLRKSRPEMNRVVRLSRKAVELTDPSHEYYLHRIEGLACALAEAAKFGAEGVLQEAASLFRQVRREAPAGSGIYISATHNFAAALLQQYRFDSEPSTLNEAMELSEEAVGLTAPWDSQLWMAMNTQSAILAELAANEADSPHLDLAISLAGRMVDLVPDNPVKRIDALDALARSLFRRWYLDQAREADLQLALDQWKEVGRERQAAPQKRAEILANAVRWTRHAKGAASALPMFLDLIDSIRLQMWEECDQPTQMDVLHENAFSVAADGAACAVELGKAAEAVRILEAGRALTWNRSWDLRDELDKIPDTAADLKADLHVQLMIADIPPLDDARAFTLNQLKNHAGATIAGLIHQVRSLAPSPSLPQPQTFYFPDQRDFIRVPTEGPVVYVNFSLERCDALIVHGGDVVPFAFPFSTKEFAETATDFAKAEDEKGDRFDRDLTANALLEWLWDNGFADLMALLRQRGCISGNRDRLWWCPTGAFSALPLHAIGKTGGMEGVADHVISSYTSSMKSLRRLRARPWKMPKAKDLLAVTIRETPSCPVCYSWPILETAERERQFLLETFGEDRVTDLHGPAATRARILDALKDHRRFHFCGHGNQTHVAHSGGMIPYDWESTKKQVSVADVAHPANFGGDLAFLGACYASGPSLGEEPVTLAQAFHHFGWQHVVSPLMSVYEDSAAALAEEFYRNLMAHGDDPAASAVSLHDAMLTLREQRPASPTHWAWFVHFGM